METNYIKKLIDAFYEGKTSAEQEQELYRYFLQDNIPAELLEEKKIFQSLYSGDDDDIELPEGFSVRLENLIDDLDRKEKSKKKIDIWRKVAGIAASLAILISVGLYTNSYYNHNDQPLLVDTYSDPEDAYNEAQKALTLISSKMNKGLDQWEKAEEDISKVSKILEEKLN